MTVLSLQQRNSFIKKLLPPARLIDPSGPFFCIRLPDYAKPAFCSFTKRYYGTMKEIDAFLSCLSHEERAGIGQLSFQPVPVLGFRTSVHMDFTYDHQNIWGATYNIHCEKIESIHVWVKCEEHFYRCMKAKITNLQFSSEFDPCMRPIKKMFWGFPHIIEYVEPITFNQLYVTEKAFSSRFEAEQDMFKFKHDIDISGFLDDVFGDG